MDILVLTGFVLKQNILRQYALDITGAVAGPQPLAIGKNSTLGILFSKDIHGLSNISSATRVNLTIKSRDHVITANLPQPIAPGSTSLLIGFFKINIFGFSVTQYPTGITTDGSDVIFTDDTLRTNNVKDIAYLA